MRMNLADHAELTQKLCDAMEIQSLHVSNICIDIAPVPPVKAIVEMNVPKQAMDAIVDLIQDAEVEIEIKEQKENDDH